MPIKSKCIYECKCERCGKEETLNRAPLMVATFSEEPQYMCLCESCLKRLIGDYYSKNNIENPDNNKEKNDIRRLFNIRIGEKSIHFSLRYPIELSECESEIYGCIKFLIKVTTEDNSIDIDEDGDTAEVAISINDNMDMESFYDRICCLKRDEVWNFKVTVTANVGEILRTYDKTCTIERQL